MGRFLLTLGLGLLYHAPASAQCTATGTQKIISGKVFNDLNGNGNDNGEAGIPGVRVDIYYDANQDGTVDAGDLLLSTSTTDANGEYRYTFTNSQSVGENFSGNVFTGTNNNSGTLNWASDFWIRDGSNINSNDVSAGNFVAGGYEFGGTQPVLQLKDDLAGAFRVIDLSFATAAFLNFTFDVHQNVESGEGFEVQLSTDNGANYTTVYTYVNPDGNSPSPPIAVTNLDLSAFVTLPASSTSRLRFITNTALENNEAIWFDNISVDITGEINDFVMATDLASYPTFFVLGGDNLETATIATGGNCDALNNFALRFPDNDSDGIADLADLDDDNDGIPDVDEGMAVLTGAYGVSLPDDADDIFEVTPSTDAALLASYIFKTSSDVTITGETINQGDGSVNQIATFDDADQIVDSLGNPQAFASFSTGIIFSSGNVESVDDSLVNQFFNPFGLGDFAGAGGGTDPDFDTGLGENDVASLSFTVNVSQISVIRGRFVFASEEYLEYVEGVFNDNIRILVNGENRALSPGGAIVSINTVNNINESAFFVDNETRTNAVGIEADGFTTVLDFSATLFPGDNTVKIGVSDGGDDLYDSWLLFEANSFEVVSSTVTGVDTDSDGIFDHLDNDSDNDSCPDAIEGAGSVVALQLNSVGQITGGEDSDGIPLLVAGGQANLADVRDDAITTQCPPCSPVIINRHVTTKLSF